MNKPAFLFDGRLLVNAEKLREIGFKVRFSVFPFSVCSVVFIVSLGRFYWSRRAVSR